MTGQYTSEDGISIRRPSVGSLAHGLIHHFPKTTLGLIAGVALAGYIADGQHRIRTVTSSFNGCMARAGEITATDTMSLRERASHFFSPLPEKELRSRKYEAQWAAERICRDKYDATTAKITALDRIIYRLTRDEPKPKPGLNWQQRASERR